MITISFTGHRPKDLVGLEEKVIAWLNDCVGKLIDNLYEKYGGINFISGGAEGVDTWAAQVVLKYREKYPNIGLIMAIPHYGHREGPKYTVESRMEYQELLDKADKVVYTYKGRYEDHGAYCMQIRNEWMVDRSSLVIAVWIGKLGGTRNCYKYAEEENKKIIRFNPLTDKVTKIS